MGDLYLNRVIDSCIDEHLKISGALLIEGPRWCGKTRTAEEHANSKLSMRSSNQINALELAIETGSKVFLEGDVSRLIDEWQDVPELWDMIRFEVDHRRKRGQFILTGSSALSLESIRHSGAGRIVHVNMRTMSLYESGESNGSISLADLFNLKKIDGYSELSVESLAFALTRGGWPETITAPSKDASKIIADYLKIMLTSELSKVDGVRRNPATANRIIKSISRNISTTANIQTIKNETSYKNKTNDDDTIRNYLKAMERIFLLENVRAWNPHIRSKTRLVTTPKWHFTDPSIATASLKVAHEALIKDYHTFRMLFESLCLRDLRVYSQPLDGEIYFFRNKNGFEVDFIIELPDGRWGAVEVKLGSKEIDETAKNLIKLRDMIDTERMRPPEFLMILTATQYGYQRPDGVYVVPIGCLKN